MLDAVPRAHDVGVEDLAPDLVGERLEVPVLHRLRPARIVHEYVESPCLAHGLVAESLAVGLAADVSLDRDGMPAVLADLTNRPFRLLPGLLIVHDDRGAFAGEGEGDAASNACAAASHERHLSLEPHARLLFGSISGRTRQ